MTQKRFHTMLNKIILAGSLIFILSSCSSPIYLPSSNKINVNEHGSFIRINSQTKSSIEGELISIDSNTIIILSEKKNQCEKIFLKDVKRFKLRYARPKHYGWTIPSIIILPFIHGYYSAITIPVNLIVTILVTSSGEIAFTYNNKNISFDKLKMFARFPQGLPLNIDIAGIK